MEVGSSGGPSKQNDIYTRAFTVYTKDYNKFPIIGHPIRSARSEDILKTAIHATYTCHADGIWGSKADPYRTIKGKCEGSTITFPAAPNMDYVYGTFVLPTVYTPWTGPKSSHCLINGKKMPHCVNVSIASNMHYIAQKIRIPLSKQVTLYAESGSLYRRMQPNNLRYQCSTNYYVRKVVPKNYCLKKSFLAGGTPDPYFAVGYVFKTKLGKTYDAKYIYLPVVENASGFAWRDGSDTEIYAVSASGRPLSNNNKKQLRHYLNIGLKTIEKDPRLYQVLGKNPWS